MAGSHDALVELGDIHEELVEINVLLIMSSDQVVKSMPGDGQHRLAVAFRIVKPIQKMNSAGSGRRDAHSESAGIFCITARRKCGCFFVSYLNESEFFLMSAQGLEDAVNPIAGNPKIVSTSQPIKRSTNKSATVFAMKLSPEINPVNLRVQMLMISRLL